MDVVYSYAVNSPELRSDFRTAFQRYAYNMPPETTTEEDKSFDGFTKQSMSLLDELDSFKLG